MRRHVQSNPLSQKARHPRYCSKKMRKKIRGEVIPPADPAYFVEVPSLASLGIPYADYNLCTIDPLELILDWTVVHERKMYAVRNRIAQPLNSNVKREWDYDIPGTVFIVNPIFLSGWICTSSVCAPWPPPPTTQSMRFASTLASST